MKKTILLTVFFLFLLIPSVNAFDVKLENTSNVKLHFQFTWLNCDWVGYPKITHMWQGEINSGEILISGLDYVPGPYVITWTNISYISDKFFEQYPFKISTSKNNVGIVYSIPNKKPVFIPGT